MERGSLLAGRYRLEEPVQAGSDGALWRARDQALDRLVSVRVIRPGHPHTPDVLDAARRAALVEDRRLVRVLDVGGPEGGGYIISEHLVGRTLEELLPRGPLPPETARRLIGEAAEALGRASARGLHHLRLTPATLVVTREGAVKVLGTAVDAALAGLDSDEDPVGADRADAVGLVALLYAGLTGRWPGPRDVDAPVRPVSRVVPPADLVANVPNDLDTLCAVTLGPHDDGPESPAALARQLAPWSPTLEQPAPQRAPHEQARSTPPGALPVLTPSRGEAAARTAETLGTPAAEVRSSAAATARRSLDDDWSLLSPSTADRSGSDAGEDGTVLGPALAAPMSRPTRTQARLVLAVVAGLVVLGLVLAVFGIHGALSGAPLVSSAPVTSTGPTAGAGAPSPSAVASTSAGAASGSAASSPAAGSTSGSPTAGPTAATVQQVQAIDPVGSDANAGTAGNVLDGDPATVWRSSRYTTPQFGGLKQGLGLYLRLNTGVVTTVKVLMSGTGGTVELRTATGPSLNGSTVVASAQATGGAAVLTPATPIVANGLLLWFTRLPQQDNGDYRLVVSEVIVS